MSFTLQLYQSNIKRLTANIWYLKKDPSKDMQYLATCEVGGNIITENNRQIYIKYLNKLNDIDIINKWSGYDDMMNSSRYRLFPDNSSQYTYRPFLHKLEDNPDHTHMLRISLSKHTDDIHTMSVTDRHVNSSFGSGIPNSSENKSLHMFYFPSIWVTKDTTKFGVITKSCYAEVLI
jgi:hypothetical protein